jgi:branched-chain amino acid transport system ATP-binding protein
MPNLYTAPSAPIDDTPRIDSSRDPLGISVDNVSWHVGGARILDDVSITVGAGEFVAIIGPNGAGKSSLLNVIAGETRASSGSVRFGETDVSRRSVRARAQLGLGRTFQTSSLFGSLTCLENVRFALQSSERRPLSLALADRADTLTAARVLLARVGMEARQTRTADALSHGDKRKLELAVAMAREPRMLLLDEPMAGVSMEDVPELVELIRGLHRDGMTVCMVEHHMHVVLDLAERIAVLHHGRLLRVGTGDEVTKDPVVKSAYLGEEI